MAQDKDYSQNGEQTIICELLAKAGIEKGRLLDIGAYSPETFSNTRRLIDSGWNAVLIEPSPGPFQSLLAHYGDNKNVALINAAVGLKAEIVRFYDSGGDAVSTTCERHRDVWQKSVSFKEFFVYTMPIQMLFDVGADFNFISLDAESTSWDLFTALPLASPALKVICVEHDNHIPEITDLGAAHGFTISHCNRENLILSR
jgi:FkbM family methyltransferase